MFSKTPLPPPPPSGGLRDRIDSSRKEGRKEGVCICVILPAVTHSYGQGIITSQADKQTNNYWNTRMPNLENWSGGLKIFCGNMHLIEF